MDNPIVATAAVGKHNVLTPTIWEMIKSIAPTMKDARYFGVSRTEQAEAIMLKGHELGLPLTSSFDYIHAIQDKLSLSPKGALALIYRSGLLESIEIKHSDDPKSVYVEVAMKRRGGLSHTRKFSVEDAKTAGIYKNKGGWENYPINMCQWRAVGYCIDVLFPDVTGGLYRFEELGGEITPDGEAIVTEWSVEEPSKPELTINDLLADGYTAEQIMSANNGIIPNTTAECEFVLGRLVDEATNMLKDE